MKMGLWGERLSKSRMSQANNLFGTLASSGGSVCEMERRKAESSRKNHNTVQQMLQEQRPEATHRHSNGFQQKQEATTPPVSKSSTTRLKQKRGSEHSPPTNNKRRQENRYTPVVGTSVERNSPLRNSLKERSVKSNILSSDIRKWTVSSEHGSRTNSHVGFKNLGNTCYMNCILAALSRLSQFSNSVMITSKLYSAKEQSTDDTPPCTQNDAEVVHQTTTDVSKESILRFLHDVVKGVASGGLVGIRPAELKDAISSKKTAFKGNDQQDAHEFLVSFLDLLDDEISTVAGGEDLSVPPLDSISLVKRLLQSKITKRFSCTKCGKGAEKPELYTCISVPLPRRKTNAKKEEIQVKDDARSSCSSPTASVVSDDENIFNISDGEDDSSGAADLSCLLSAAFEGESSISRNCDSCDSTNSRVSTQITELPHYLVLHVNRFRVIQKGGAKTSFHVIKDDQPIYIPESLELKSFLASSQVTFPPPLNFSFSDVGDLEVAEKVVEGTRTSYSLRSVVHHYGASTSSGHYVTDFLGEDAVWYHANDSIISECSSPSKESKTCYLLFYERDQT
eukprot:TRINITY_DN20980_c0_g1_i1.p1 TRINITY_DN20980_c0_g1~~TRINITY_DN20980_c0_g1_i1.p1  ORF type:complete len:566 (+),score=88.31 TRINITY_DN20980_c0_g1_i1:38-1735(+)